MIFYLLCIAMGVLFGTGHFIFAALILILIIAAAFMKDTKGWP